MFCLRPDSVNTHCDVRMNPRICHCYSCDTHYGNPHREAIFPLQNMCRTAIVQNRGKKQRFSHIYG